MPIIDPGMTVVDDFGKPLLSKDAIHLPRPDNMPVAPVSTQEIPSAIQGPAQIAPTPQAQGQVNLPKYSIPSDRYAEVERSMPQRDDPSFQHHGLQKFGDILSSIQGGLLTAPARYNEIKQAPYNRAMSDWQDKLAAIKPEVQYEEFQGKERGEEKRAEATLAATEAHRRATEANTSKLRDIEQQRTDIEGNKVNEKIAQDTALRKLAERRLDLVRIMHPEKKISKDDKYIDIVAKEIKGEELDPEEQAYKKSFETWTNVTKTQPGVARAVAYGQNKPVQVATPDGSSNWDTAGHAIKTGAPTTSSTSFQVNRAKALASVPTSTSRTMIQMAKTVLPQMQSISDEVDQLATKLGPVTGRWNDLWVNKAGFNDPDFAKLDQNLDLLASAIVRTHFGARGGQQYQEKLRKNFSEAQSPEDLKARIAGADGWILGYANMGKDPKDPPKVNRPGEVIINKRRPVE